MMFLVTRVLWGNRASHVKPDQVKNIVILKFGCHGHFTLFYQAQKKLEFKLFLWASNSGVAKTRVRVTLRVRVRVMVRVRVRDYKKKTRKI